MKYKLLYCGGCYWHYPKNAAHMGVANQCANCGRWQLYFAQSDSLQEIHDFMREAGMGRRLVWPAGEEKQ